MSIFKFIALSMLLVNIGGFAITTTDMNIWTTINSGLIGCLLGVLFCTKD